MSERLIISVVEEVQREMGMPVFVSFDNREPSDPVVAFWVPGAIHFVYRHIQTLLQVPQSHFSIVEELHFMRMEKLIIDEAYSPLNRFTLFSENEIRELFQTIEATTKNTINAPFGFYYHEPAVLMDPMLTIKDENAGVDLLKLHFHIATKEWYCTHDEPDVHIPIQQEQQFLDLLADRLIEEGYDLDELFD